MATAGAAAHHPQQQQQSPRVDAAGQHDRKTLRGKRFAGTYGLSRPRKPRQDRPPHHPRGPQQQQQEQEHERFFVVPPPARPSPRPSAPYLLL